jgi:hypothetical protein
LEAETLEKYLVFKRYFVGNFYKILKDFYNKNQFILPTSRAISSPRRRYNIQRGKKLLFCSWHILGF